MCESCENIQIMSIPRNYFINQYLTIYSKQYLKGSIPDLAML